MLSVKEAIIVEGRYDKNTVSQAVDALILETGGFGIFSDSEKRKYFRMIAEKRGIIILTDPDGAGFVIRNFLKGCVPSEYIKNAYVPDVLGKERRKANPSKEGKLGVEGMTKEIIIESLRRAGATFTDEPPKTSGGITKAKLYSLGICGKPDSSAKRRVLQQKLGLPERMTANALLDALNVIMTSQELEAILSDQE